MPRRPFPIDATLTAIAIGYRNPAHTLIGRRVLPPLNVLNESFKYSVFPLADGFTVPETRVGRKSQPNQVEFTVEELDSSVDDFGLDDAIPYSDVEAARQARAEKRSIFDPRTSAVEGLTNLIELAREVRAAAIVQNAANYAADKKIALAGTDKFSDYVIFGFAAWGHLLKLYPAATAAPFSLLVPVSGTLSAALILGETYGPLRLAGMVLIFIGLAVLVMPRRSG